ncbi:SRPBCC family protein [Asticcacaulis sp. EMRT-3]|uniref:SRPBCC family protein n=1 Tax=Asticcacaulis sp. EMRT-3 TaxID=3040349 RepID=UPI0024AF53C7|nr:SRPBCC family protein [Asticcacaulis sp. EMRT-3]MDI7775057.1 SRPBCC family protein [Asticcacaulis sp. EMRT-3]
MTLVCETHIDLPQAPAQVFALLDDFSRVPDWLTRCEGLAKQGHGPNAAGDKLRYAYVEGGKHRLMDGVILTHDAPYRMTCRYFDKMMQVIVDFQLEPSGNGTRLTHRIEIMPQSFMARLLTPMIRAKLPQQTKQAMESLRGLLARQMAA